MTKAQLSTAITLAQSKDPLTGEDISLFDGFGLKDFKPVTCTLRQLAALVRWQAVNFNGTIDAAALNEIVSAGRHKFDVV
jgi:hypothetical protein